MPSNMRNRNIKHSTTASLNTYSGLEMEDHPNSCIFNYGQSGTASYHLKTFYAKSNESSGKKYNLGRIYLTYIIFLGIIRI